MTGFTALSASYGGGAPYNLVPPAIVVCDQDGNVVDGPVRVGRLLRLTDGTWIGQPTRHLYQWYSKSTGNWLPIPGADQSYYGVQDSDFTGPSQTYFYCRVTAGNWSGFAAPINTVSVGPVVMGVDYLVIAGGGGGGRGTCYTGGGGGGGGALNGCFCLARSSQINLVVTVGAGGRGGGTYTCCSNYKGENGKNSELKSSVAGISLTAIGGGGGGGGYGTGGSDGRSGGTGGGAAGPNYTGPARIGGNGTTGQGRRGGNVCQFGGGNGNPDQGTGGAAGGGGALNTSFGSGGGGGRNGGEGGPGRFSYVGIGRNNPFLGTLDFSASGTVVTVTSVDAGQVHLGMEFDYRYCCQPYTPCMAGFSSCTTVSAFLSGTGGVGTYKMNKPAPVSRINYAARGEGANYGAGGGGSTRCKICNCYLNRFNNGGYGGRGGGGKGGTGWPRWPSTAYGSQINAQPGTNGLGGGGGGSGYSSNTGAAGGSGVVIIDYPATSSLFDLSGSGNVAANAYVGSYCCSGITHQYIKFVGGTVTASYKT